MVEFKLTNEANEQAKKDREAKAEATTTEQVAEAEPKKVRRSRKAKEAVTV